MPKRYAYDLTHFSAVAGMIGRIQGLSTIPVVAGDSHDIEIISVVRQAPLVRQLTIDAQVKVNVFFIRHNQIYSNWQDFIEGGVDESVSLGYASSSIDEADALHFHGCGTDVYGSPPDWLIHGYNSIWNNWYRVPNVSAEIDLDFHPTADDERHFGYEAALLPSYLTPGDDSQGDLDSSDRVIDTSSTLDLVDLAELKARFKTELQRNWLDQRYRDIMANSFSRVPHAYADNRPELIFTQSNWLSGYDVNGTDEVGLGQYVVKSEGVFRYRVPRRYFDEHGTLWIQIVVRYPTLVSGHNHYLVNKSDPSYLELAGDPIALANQNPIALTEANFAVGGGATEFGLYPYAQWYRTHPHHIHRDFERLQGLPLLKATEVDGSSLDERTYVQPRLYDDIYRTTGTRHYQVISKIADNAMRVIPPASRSIFAGTDNV